MSTNYDTVTGGVCDVSSSTTWVEVMAYALFTINVIPRIPIVGVVATKMVAPMIDLSLYIYRNYHHDAIIES